MASPNQEQFLHVLQHEWATYVARFQALPPEARAEFLTKQGYTRFGDLLAHLIGWWKVGRQNIAQYLADPLYQSPKYDVDQFNAAAVENARTMTEAELLDQFEQTRRSFLEWTRALPESAFQNEKVTNQLKMELVGHLSEHEIPQVSE